MKLYIKRGQEEKKGFFGGHKGMTFLLSCRIELTPDETALIEKYKQWDYPVLVFKSTSGSDVVWTVKMLVKEGRTVTCDGVGALFENEDEVKKACQDFKTVLTVMASFGGEEVIEY